MPSCKMEPADCLTAEDDVPQSMAFTVTFDSAKSANNKFIKRHIRNLSLPIAKVYDNKAGGDSAVNGKLIKKPGNHSEGYFSSDPEEDHPESKSASDVNLGKELSYDISERSEEMGEVTPEGEDEECGSDVASEAGTYTIEPENPEVITARLSIDAKFGIHHDSGKPNPSRETSTWVNEWATQVVNHKSASPTFNVNEHSKSSLTRTQGATKIPSPLTTRARFGVKNPRFKSEPSETLSSSPQPPPTLKTPTPTISHNRLTRSKDDCSDSSLETESYLKTTEKVMSAIAARMSLSLDSGGESDVDVRGSKNTAPLQHSDSSASESGLKSTSHNTNTTTTRYNRAFSLRRGRLEDSGGKKTPTGNEPQNNSRTVRRSESVSKSTQQLAPSSLNSSQPTRPKATTPQPIARTDTGRFSMRSKQSPQVTTPVHKSPQLSLANNNGMNTKKKSSGGGRSNSTLSSKEVEFQNWKRRKSYDPMKAAAEGKKKEAAKKLPPNVMTQSTTNATTTPKSPVNSVLRSASFHGTRQLGGPSSSEEDEEITLSAEDEDWPVPTAPKTSLENTPRGSRVSLYSNNSNSSPRTRHKLEGVDNLVVSAIYGMSNKLKVTASTLLKKLRYLYDEDSDKSKQLGIEIEQLEITDQSGSPHKSPSKELASTLRNLKRLDSTLKIIDEVLFDDEDFE